MAKPGERFHIDARGIHADGMVFLQFRHNFSIN